MPGPAHIQRSIQGMMSTPRKLLLPGLLVLMLCGPMWAGAQSKQIMRADEFYDAGGYAEALPLYKDNLVTLEKEKLGDYLFKVAECYRRTGNARQASLWYAKAIMRECTNPKAHLYYANALLSDEKYDLAREEYEIYKKLMPNDPLGDNGLRSVELAALWSESPSGYEVRPMSVLNSKANDYSPMYGSSDYRVIMLSSSRDAATGNLRHAATGEKFADIFTSKSNTDGRWSKPKGVSDVINTNAEEGTPSFSGDFSKIYFTRCRMMKREKQGCQILESTSGDEGWGVPQMLPLAPDSMIVAHPSLSEDGLTLYFTSDIAGGFGGLDIWKVTRSSMSDPWGDPINLGSSINTGGDEVFPFIHPDGTFYFSSNGHPGMGGLDIFRYYKDAEGKMQLENMRYPVNSPADDFGITIQKKREEGFFTSNRKGGRGGDDIYWFYLPPLEFNLLGNITTEDGTHPLANTKVRLAGSDGSIQTSETNAEGKFKFMLTPNTDYVAISNNKGFLNGKTKISTRGKGASEDIKVDIAMKSTAKPIVLPNVFYNFNAWDLRPESVESLNLLVDLLKDNPNIIIELGSHTDSKGSQQYNYELSQKRAQSVVNYLIERQIPAARLRAKGYAQTMPFVVDQALNARCPALPIGQPLTPEFIESLQNEADREIAEQANRRTEFRVLRDDYPVAPASR